MRGYVMKMVHAIALPVIAASLVLAQGAALAQERAYPDKPVRMLVSTLPGSPSDILARITAPKLGEALGRTFVVDNRTGANGNIAYEITARAAPDGYTIVLAAAGLAINPSLYDKVSYHPIKDFAPIALGIVVPNLLVVHPAVPAHTVQEFVVFARAQKGKLVFASAGNGSSGHLALELFRLQAKFDVVHVPFKGGGPALVDVIAGQSQALFSLALAATPHVKSGRVRALAITSAKRSPVAPEIPTVAESGFPGFEVQGWFGWLAPAATPPVILRTLNAEINKTLADPDVRERLLSLGSEPVGGTPQDFARLIKSEFERWAGVIRQANIRID
jgi:tripartite-type tricarboxylate transporter receptor subunit TctC